MGKTAYQYINLDDLTMVTNHTVVTSGKNTNADNDNNVMPPQPSGPSSLSPSVQPSDTDNNVAMIRPTDKEENHYNNHVELFLSCLRRAG